MKKPLFILLIIFLFPIMKMNATSIHSYDIMPCENDSVPSFDIQWGMKLDFRNHPIEEGKGGNNKPRGVNTTNILPNVWINGCILTLQGKYTIDNLRCEILDAYESTTLTQYICIRKGETTTWSIASLPAGNYFLLLTISGEQYIAEFDL